MEEDLILQQPADRRLGTGNSLPPGPPGAENDGADYDTKRSKSEKESNKNITSRSSRRRSPSGSPPRTRRKSPSRGRRSPSPLDGGGRRRRRSPTPPRRNRFRDYSPDRRRFDGGGRSTRRSPDRRRAAGGSAGSGRGFRYRGRSNSRSRSHSASPRRNSGGRWSPKKKPSSPPINAPPPPQVSQPPPQVQQPPPQTQYAAIPPQIYPTDNYAPPAYNQYSVPPPQPAPTFQPPPQADTYSMQTPAPPVFNAAYPPPPVWTTTNDTYTQQPWIPTPDTNQLQQLTQQPPPTVPPASIPPPQLAVPQQQQPPPVIEVPPPVAIDSSSKRDAVAKEAENQRDELKRQRSSYLKKTSLLRKELKMLKEQRKDLHKGKSAPPSPTTKGFIDENEKLQNQIQKKLSTIENVIDMLTGIIGEENLDRNEERYDSDKSVKEDLSKKHSNKEQQQLLPQQQNISGSGERGRKKKRKKSTSSSGSSSGSSSSSTSSSSSSSSSENEEDDDDDSSPERLKNKAIASMKSKAKDALKREALAVAKLKEDRLFDEKKRFNYVFYDPEMHWCQTCDVFPKTAKDYLNHLHSKEHMDRETIETPWHIDMITDQFPTYDNAPTKRTPIRGLTFFIPASSWFCKLCSIWMGDLHCASTHLKSQLHANKYNAFLEKNPHYEVNWLADRQRVLNERKTLPLPSQITSVSTTAAETVPSKKSKKDEKAKKRKKKSSDKKDKKKKSKRSKKHKKNAGTTSTSSSSSSSDSEKVKDSKIKSPIMIQSLDNPNPALSIRVAMRKQDLTKGDDETPPPAPRMRIDSGPHPVPAPITPHIVSTLMTNTTGGAGANSLSSAGIGRLSKWTEAQDSSAKAAAATTSHHIVAGEGDSKHDDAILQQWNTVQPVISESEKKLLEQLKGKLKNKPREEGTTPAGASIRNSDADKRIRDRDRDRERERDRSDRDRDRDRNDRDRIDRNNDRDRRRRSRSPFFGGGGGRGVSGGGRGRLRRTRSRSRSRSRGRVGSPLGRRRRTRSRSRGRRSRSFDRRRRYSRSRSRTRSGSRGRIEKAIVRQPEFRPRVPENNNNREKRSTTESKDKKNGDKKTKTATANLVAAVASGKKLPFIGKMPVFKKQTSGQAEGNGVDAMTSYPIDNNQQSVSFPTQRPLAPTAAQIQMAMMEDAYGNAPPFHPDAGMMMEYEELMPDPIQFVNLMGQAPPPPPPPAAADDEAKKGDGTDLTEDTEDILPPGIDEAEKDDCVTRPITHGPLSSKGPLPKDLEEALNIIFPGDKKPGDGEAEGEPKTKSTGETQIIVDEPVMQPEDLAKEGIHMITIEETSLAGLDEASQMSMNEPLVFNKKLVNSLKPKVAEASSKDAARIGLPITKPPPPPKGDTILKSTETSAKTVSAEVTPARLNGTDTNSNAKAGAANTAVKTQASDAKQITKDEETLAVTVHDDIPMPDGKTSEDVSNIVYDLDDIPQPPPSPTESEKNRRQEELNDLAMLGIDADDMAAQCI